MKFPRKSLSLTLALALMAVPALAQSASSKTLTQQASAEQTRQQESKKPELKPLEDKQNPQLVGKRDINKGSVNFYSLDKEVALGRQLAAEVDRESKMVEDPLVNEYVNRVAQNIVLHSDAKVPFTIKVIEANEVNAFALPGGFLYVNRGLVEAADNEAELAGVMAHEIAHVTARHGVEQASKGQLINYASIPLIFMGGLGGYIVQQVAGLAIPLTFLKFSRGAEKEADRLGAQYMWAAGYDPNAMVTFFEKLQAKDKKKPGAIAKAFSTHPLTEDRIREVRSLLERFPDKGEYQLTTSEFNQMKGRLLSTRAASPGFGGTENKDRPTLKRRPQADGAGDSTSGESSTTDDSTSGRPTLKRRTDSGTEQKTDSTMDSNSSGQQESAPARPTLKRRTDTGN